MTTVEHPVAPPMPGRQDSIMTVDMHIPGAWNGTNPSTPVPIKEDMKYFGETLKTVPGTVQGYMPAKETVAATGSSVLNKAVGIVPASVMNTATNVLPKSMQPTMSPTAADAAPPTHPSDLSNEHPITTTTNTITHADLTPKGENPPGGTTLMDKAAAILPAGVVGAAASYLPASMTNKTAPTTTEATPATADAPLLPAPVTVDGPNQPAALKTTADDHTVPTESTTSPTWTDTAKSILPAGAAAYLPSALSPTTAPKEEVPATTQNVASTKSIPPVTGPLVGSTVSPDADVQEALSKAANPHEYKSEIVPPMHSHPSTAPSLPPKDDHGSLKSTQAVGGTTPMTLNSYDAEGDGYPEHNKKGVSGLAAMAATGGIGALAVDHGLKDQRDAAVKQHDGPTRPTEAPVKDSFMHVVIPATPGAGLHEQEMFDKKAVKTTGDGTLATHGTLKKKDRSGSVSAGEASPSSPSKTGMFSGIRKLTKKRDRSVSKGHQRDTSIDDAAPPVPSHDNSLDTKDSNSPRSSPTNAGEEKKEKHVLHKDPPVGYGTHPTTGKDETSPTTANIDGATSTSNPTTDSTPSMLSHPYSPSSPASSPSKVGFREKVKGEFMVVQGSLTRDKGLKEAGEKMKKGTL